MKQNKLNTIKTSGFKTPKDYFSQVEEQILNEVKIVDKVDQSGFDVPESYFDTVESAILDTVASESDTKVVRLFPWKKIMYSTAVAAVLILMFSLFFKSSDHVSWDDLEIVSIENYLEYEDYTSNELASLLTDDELDNDNFIDNEIPETSIEDYLLDNAELEDLIIE
ncbi:hypothetical protein [uncultured Psychroserpens sp.]|uniref:hypothetical protein n=1 Tax=uncultured Psychroserpens sp. TaxID=255436 RepID=UPI0026059BBE|nr:hypothetical protein [uncultured Psychroserpens sp.]